jgi:hypothetical protein
MLKCRKSPTEMTAGSIYLLKPRITPLAQAQGSNEREVEGLPFAIQMLHGFPDVAAPGSDIGMPSDVLRCFSLPPQMLQLVINVLQLANSQKDTKSSYISVSAQPVRWACPVGCKAKHGSEGAIHEIRIL